MNFYHLLNPEAIQLATNGINSRKKVLETMATLFARNNAAINLQNTLSSLLEREKLGSTALGKNIAIPHCRLAQLDKPQAALLRIESGIDYDAPDNLPVRLFFGLLVPQDAIDEHLKILASLMEMLHKEHVVEALKQAADSQQMQSILKDSLSG